MISFLVQISNLKDLLEICKNFKIESLKSKYTKLKQVRNDLIKILA